MALFDYITDKVAEAAGGLFEGLVKTLTAMIESIGESPDNAAATLTLLGFIALILLMFRTYGVTRRAMR